MIIFGTNDILTSARALIMRDGGNVQVQDTALLLWAGEEVRKLWALVGRVNKDRVTKVGTFTIGAGANTYDLAAIGDLWQFRGLSYSPDGGVSYQRVKPLHFQQRGGYGVSGRRFMLRGTVLDLYPQQNAVGNYQVWYLYGPPVAAAGNVLSLPIGGDEFVAQGIAAKARGRFYEDPSGLTAGQRVVWEQTIRPSLVFEANALSAGIPDMSDEDDE